MSTKFNFLPVSLKRSITVWNNFTGFPCERFHSLSKILCIVVFTLTAVSVDVRNGCSKEIFLDQSNTENVILDVIDGKSDEKYKQAHSFVSITAIRNGTYLIANYKEIFKFESSTGKLSKMRTFSYGKVVGEFVPTGVYYSKNTYNLYVANYTANNILVFTVDLIHNRLIFKHEIKSENTIGPENVFVSNNGQYVAVANYDGGTVELFERKNDTFLELWNQNIPQVHGVCILNDKVYATGLASRKIYKMNITTGVIERSSGILHSDPEKNGFMWPTSIYPLEENRLVVSDAHTGYIYVLDSDTLTINEYFGGNGPTFQYLHMPYAVMIDRSNFFILSTFQDRIIKGNISGWKVETNYFFKDKNWDIVSVENPANHLREYDTYIYRKGPVVKILDKEYYLGFGHMYPVENNLPVIRFPDVATLNNNNSYIYFTDAVSISSDEQVLVSDRSLMAFYVYNKTHGLQYTIPFRISETDNWVIDDKIISSSGIFNLDKIVPLIHKKIQYLSEARRENGLLDYNDYWRILYNNSKLFLFYSHPVFIEKLKSLFKSKEGTSFLEDYLILLKNKKASRNDVEKLANTFYRKYLENTYSDYNELVSVQMLTDAPINR